jgi:hypothetical protein
MYTDDDLKRAVKDGVLSQESIEKFQTYVAQSKNVVLADEERFRLVSSFNDIFVLIASVMLIFGIAYVFGRTWGSFSCAVVAWLLAEIFTKSRRMASPSIVYAAVFSIAPAFGMMSLLDSYSQLAININEFYALAGASAFLAACAALFWKRFQVPIVITLFWGAIISLVYMLIIAATGGPREYHVPFFLIAGLGAFAMAMRYDMQDVKRVTLNADIAFWLHLLAASLIVHTVFQLLQMIGEKGSLLSAIIAISALFFFIFVALVIDRRATLVSASIYVITALIANFRQLDVSKDNAGLAMLMVGACLLVLSWGWSPARKRLINLLPHSLANRLPAA